jgi:hypothetical protein
MLLLRLRHSWRLFALVAGAALLVVIGIVAVIQHNKDDAYQPTAAEVPMFSHLRHATGTEANNARDAMYEIEHDAKKPTTIDTYVATSDFRTVYTPHHMAIMLYPGVKWLGGQLGQVILVTRLTDAQYHWKPDAKFKKQIDNFYLANVVYDPFCRAYNMGAATLKACQSTPEQRRSVTTAQQSALRGMTADEAYEMSRAIYDLPVGRTVKYAWTEPIGTEMLLAPPMASPEVKVTVLRPGQILTGGNLGSRYVALSTTYHRYYNVAEYDDARVVIVDPVVHLCDDYSGVKPYLGPEVITYYGRYCS